MIERSRRLASPLMVLGLVLAASSGVALAAGPHDEPPPLTPTAELAGASPGPTDGAAPPARRLERMAALAQATTPDTNTNVDPDFMEPPPLQPPVGDGTPTVQGEREIVEGEEEDEEELGVEIEDRTLPPLEEPAAAAPRATPRAVAAGPVAAPIEELPRTGFELGVLIPLGGALFLTGLVLRRVTRPLGELAVA